MYRNPEFQKTANFAVLSVSYEKADAETRSKFAFFEEHIKDFLSSLYQEQLGDAFVVSTCNRTEIYTTTQNYLSVAEEFCKTTGVSLNDFLKFANIFTQDDALNHLFRVAGGLESQILGDFEIIGQIKNAYNRFKKEKKYSNPYLERAINSAIQISKKIKNETGISNGAASVSYAAVHYILSNQNQVADKNILLLGTGEIGQNTVENLVKHIHQPQVKVMNRTAEKAIKIAEKYQIPHIEFSDLDAELKKTDILIVATGAAHPIINKSHFPNGKETLILDLSIPYNVEKDVVENPNVKLVDVDELSFKINHTLEQRRKEIPKAEEIIEKMTVDFTEWESKRKMVPKIHHFKDLLTDIERNEMHKIHKKFRYVDIEDMELTEMMINKLTGRFAKYIIDNPSKADEISALMKEIMVDQFKKDDHGQH